MMLCISIEPPLPTLYLPMDRVSGSNLPTDIGGILGTLENAPPLIPKGIRGKALQLNGIDQAVNLGNQRQRCLGELDLKSLILYIYKYIYIVLTI